MCHDCSQRTDTRNEHTRFQVLGRRERENPFVTVHLDSDQVRDNCMNSLHAQDPACRLPFKARHQTEPSDTPALRPACHKCEESGPTVTRSRVPDTSACHVPRPPSWMIGLNSPFSLSSKGHNHEAQGTVSIKPVLSSSLRALVLASNV